MTTTGENRDVPLRHALATLAYRAAKALRDAPADFSSFRPAAGSQSAGEILAHMGDLMDWVLSQARGKEQWHNATPDAWNVDSARFFTALTAFDAYLASEAEVYTGSKRLPGCRG